MPHDYYGKLSLAAKLSTQPAPAGGNELLMSPAPMPSDDGGYGTVTAQLVSCGLGTSQCQGVAGGVCLIERGMAYFCKPRGQACC